MGAACPPRLSFAFDGPALVSVNDAVYGALVSPAAILGSSADIVWGELVRVSPTLVSANETIYRPLTCPVRVPDDWDWAGPYVYIPGGWHWCGPRAL